MKRYNLALIGAGALALASSAPTLPTTRAAMMMGTLKLLSPAPGTVVSGASVPVTVGIKDFSSTCATAGKAPRNGQGHWHLLLDGALVNMYCGTHATLSLRNVAPGTHTVEAMLAANNHMDMMGKGQTAMATFVYRPVHALPALTPYSASGKPTIRIVAPAPGASVGERFPVTLAWTNFRPSCDLLGKKNVAGYGHWHLNVDSMNGPMMGMGTMLAMGCGHTTTVYTDELSPGRHRLFALLVDNQHAPLMPAVATSVTFNVKAPVGAVAGTVQTARIVSDPTTVGRYVPATLRLSVGQRVTFTNASDAAHTVTADNRAFDSGNIASGASWIFTAARAGTFTYTCAYHPNMHGTIIVTA